MTSNAILSPRSEPSGLACARTYAVVITATLLAAVLLRFVALDRYPLPLHQDELSNIYDGYSLATTGADRTGARWPILLRGMGPGDYRPALYAYLAAVTTGVCGFSVWAGRVPAAVAGLLTVLLVFLFARRLLGRSGGLLALLFATFSPILLQYGRQAHEGTCLPPLFAILTVYLLYRGLEASHREAESPAPGQTPRTGLFCLASAGLVVGLSTNAYGAQRLTGPLLVLLGCGLILWVIGWRKRAPKRAGIALALFALSASMGALPQIYAMMDQPQEFFARAGNVGHDWRYGPRWWAGTLTAGYTAHFNARQLFFSTGDYAHLSVARLGVAAFPFLYFGLVVAMWRFIARRDSACVLLLGAVMICILPAVASKYEDDPAVIRASGVWALYPVVSALGAVALGSLIRAGWGRLVRTTTQRHEGSARLATAVLAVAIVVVGVRNINEYLARPEWQNATGQNDLVRIGEWLRGRGEGFERVYVDTPRYFPHLYVAVFSGMHPREFQHTPRESMITPTGWETVQRFGKFYLADLSQAESDWAASDRDEPWLYINADGETITFRPAGVTRGHELALTPVPSRTYRP